MRPRWATRPSPSRAPSGSCSSCSGPAATTSRSSPTCPRIRPWWNASSGCATAFARRTAWQPRSASDRGSCTRPVSSTREGLTLASSSSSPPIRRRTFRSRGGRSPSARSSRPRRWATSPRSSVAAGAPCGCTSAISTRDSSGWRRWSTRPSGCRDEAAGQPGDPDLRHSKVGSSMQVGIAGLGRMGAGMARRAARGGHDVVAWNRTEAVATEIAGEAENDGRIAVAEPMERLVEMMAAPRHVVISVPSGKATDDMIDQLAGILEPGDVIVDAGNSRFHDSRRHAVELAEKGIEWLDMGVSGGVWGLQVGFCAMLGGKREVFDRFEPVVKTLAPENGYLYCGDAGAGHYTKMVHNGIEYGIMQAYGEGFDILHASDYDLDLAAIARMWNNGSVIRSWLLELAGNAFEKEGSDLEKVHGWVADSGEGRWTVAEAIDHDVPAPIITLSLIERFRSRREPDSYTDRVLAALRNEFGGHAIKDRG